MENTIIITGAQASGKTFLAQTIKRFLKEKAVLETNYQEFQFKTNFDLLRKKLVIIEEVPSREVSKILDRIVDFSPRIKDPIFLIICNSIPEFDKKYDFTEIKCTR